MSEMLSHEFLNRLHPVHLAFDEAGALRFRSDEAASLFPDAVSLFDAFAPNSAREILELIQALKEQSKDGGSIDVFSIQRYSTWHSTLTRLDDSGHWLLCMKLAAKKTLSPDLEQSFSAQEGMELLRQNLFYEQLLHQLPAEVAVFDTEFKFLFVNKQAIKNEELRRWLIGRSEIEYWKSKSLPLDKALQRIEGFKKAVAERKSTAVEEIFHQGTEQEKQYIRVTHPYFKDDELQFLLTYGIDITSLKHTESKLLQQNAELEKVNAELDQFVYSASHNLRAPLLSMKGLLSLISLDDTALEDRNRFMSEVYKSIERLDATIHDIIEYSKNARLAITPEEVDLMTIIHSTIDDLKFFDREKVHIHVDTNIGAAFFSDARRIRSVVHNLMSNSVKYADPHKTDRFLTVKVETTPLDCTMTFIDNGIGIAAENQDRVFDMFYRGTSQRNGSGLGLYIVKEMVHKLGGRVMLSSELNIGTTISIAIPNLERELMES